MTVASEMDEEEKRRRDAPMGDISPETVAAGMQDDEPPTTRTIGPPELAISAQGDDSQAPDEAPQGAGPSDWAQYSPTPDVKADTSRADFAKQLAGIVSQRYQPRAELSDAAIAKARSDRQQQIQNNDMSRAIQSWLLRKPFEPTPPEDTATELTQQRTKEEASFEKDRSMQLALAKALKGEKPAEMTPYQRAELDMRGKELGAKRVEKANALEARKRTMLSLYPERKADIEALTDLGDAQALQTALEGRLGRENTQTHQDTAAAASQAHSDEMQRRAEAFTKSMKEWELTHRPLTADQSSQLEGIEKSDAALDTFQKSLGDVSTAAGKVGAATGRLGGALDLPGGSFKAAREGTAIALARGLEGGMARPGNVEIIQHMLPEASDGDDVKRQKLATIREFIANNRDSFKRALEQGGSAPLRPTEPRPKVELPSTAKPPPGVIPPNATNVKQLKNGKWIYTLPDNTVETWSPR